MSFAKSFSLAIANITFDKKRSILTMLGIIVGVAAVIILVSLMNGMTCMINDTFSDMGTTSITVSVTSRGGSRVVEEEDMYQLRDDNPELLEGVSPTVSMMRSTIKRPGETDSVTTSVTGVSEEYADMENLELQSGTFLNYMDMQNITKNCVIGTYIQKELFGSEQAIGNKIKINNTPYTVVGIIEEQDDSSSSSSDNAIYIPYTTAFRASSNASINSFLFFKVPSSSIFFASLNNTLSLFSSIDNESNFFLSSSLLASSSAFFISSSLNFSFNVGDCTSISNSTI